MMVVFPRLTDKCASKFNFLLIEYNIAIRRSFVGADEVRINHKLI